MVHKKAKRKNLVILLMCLVMVLCRGLTCADGTAYAEGEESRAEDDNLLYLMGTADYDKAYDVLSMINSERSKRGIATLSMDQTLMDAAMTRAAETAIYFEHARPNGAKWSSVDPKVKGENLGKGTDSASRIMVLWMQSPGHRENVLRKQFHSVGVACFAYGGTTYWVQLYGTEGSDGAEKPENGDVSVGIDLPEDGAFKFDYEITQGPGGPAVWRAASYTGDENNEETAKEPLRMFEGESIALGLTGDYLVFDSSRIRWESSNPGAATVDERGNLKITGPGDVVITASSGSIERASLNIAAKSHINDTYIVEAISGAQDISKRKYLDVPVCPKLAVLGDEGILKEGRDYTVMYRRNGGPGEAEMEIRGVGDYGGIVTRTFTIE